ncbi:endonuclease/exonuclease/phosphatase family protein [Algoriphagus aestuariicola]|jgi:endonuclease/exonuclease/phosphatase family metal-dependent hydrolase|uniref:Endonuclease/exonuclease/phosphatase family protein n=1 Tax=Algoriphagus aestuariicola TaxID=1852016 RepID=A0ABS3BXC7_9BACT|nr:endonuclease/exonuclease/phosphatase family protein [Algoriphagus aestuariicola]MBN7803506.1 endonuclease/exonuclease/phosphatase family protein [Algoriphagus aestuariicola]
MNLKTLLTLLFPFALAQVQAQNHQFATFNIRWDNPGDAGNLWEDRASKVIHLIQFHKIGLVGTQEGLHHQIEELSKGLGYEYLGVGRDDGAQKGEYTAILYDPKLYKMEDSGTFWLSPTPEKPSKGWDASLNRICSWGQFKDKDGKRFYVFNIHYDHIGQQAREESSKLVATKAKEINKGNFPAIWMGDFNVTPDNPAYQTITSNPAWKDARLISKIPAYGPAGTFTAFDWEKMPDGIIDHIFVSGKIEVLRHGILTDNYGKKYPSDHFPVMVELKF